MGEEENQKEVGMSWRPFISLFSFIILALFFGIVGWVTESTIIKWAAPAIGLALIAVGLGVNSLMIALHTYRRMTEMDATLARIEGLQEEIQKEQREQASSHSPVVKSLQALSQYYFDYIAKQKGEDEQQQ